MRKKSNTARSLTVSIVGAGNLGTALVLTLPSAGYEVKFIAVRAKSDNRRRTKALAHKVKAQAFQKRKGSGHQNRTPFQSY